MTAFALDFNALGAKASAEKNIDMTKAQVGGGDYEPPKAGPCQLRFVGYVETGKHAGTYQGKATLKPYATFIFELSGKNHPPTEGADGVKHPIRVSCDVNISLSDRSQFYALARRLLYAGSKTHVIQCLGDAYKGKLIHRKYTAGGKERVAVEFWDKTAKQWNIEAPRYPVLDADGEETGEVKVLNVAPVMGEMKGFLWDCSDDAALKAMWDSLYIDGEYPERKDASGVVTAKAKSKNVLQNKIKSAVNFKGSPIYNLLQANGQSVDIPEAEDMTGTDDEDVSDVPFREKEKVVVVPTGQDADDALNGII